MGHRDASGRHVLQKRLTFELQNFSVCTYIASSSDLGLGYFPPAISFRLSCSCWVSGVVDLRSSFTSRHKQLPQLSECLLVHTYICAPGQRQVLDLLELELQIFGSGLLWVLRTEIGFNSRCSLTPEPSISPALGRHLFSTDKICCNFYFTFFLSLIFPEISSWNWCGIFK